MGFIITHSPNLTSNAVKTNADIPANSADMVILTGNQIECKNIRNSDIKAILNENTNALSALNKSNNINKFSNFKPGELSITAEAFTYKKDTSPYKMSDWAGYNHNASGPLIVDQNIEVELNSKTATTTRDITINVGEFDFINKNIDGQGVYDYIYAELWNDTTSTLVRSIHQQMTSGSAAQTVNTGSIGLGGNRTRDYYMLIWLSTDTPNGVEKVAIPTDNRVDISVIHGLGEIAVVTMLSPPAEIASVEFQNATMSNTGSKDWSFEVRFRDSSNFVAEVIDFNLRALYTDENDVSRSEIVHAGKVITGANYVEVAHSDTNGSSLSYNVKAASNVTMRFENITT